MDLGMPIPHDSHFDLDPEIKCEAAWAGPVLRPATLLTERRGASVRIRDAGGGWHREPHALQPFDSMLSELADPHRAPELLTLRERIRAWRFYDHLRTDAQAPARATQVGTRTPVLSHDGADLAAALQTITEIGDFAALDKAVDHAFPGSRVVIVNHEGRFDLALHQPGLPRCTAPSCPTERCVTCSGWPPCSPPGHPSYSSSTSPKPACTPSSCPHSPS
jgi:predicted ATPase